MSGWRSWARLDGALDSLACRDTEGLGVGEVFGKVAGKAVDFLTTLGDVYGGIQALQAIFGAFGTDAEGAGNGFRLLKGPIDLVRGGFAGLAGLGGTLRTAMSGIGMAAGTAGVHLGTLASGGFTRLAALGGTLIPVIRGVGAALMTVALSPVGLIVTALAGLVAAGVRCGRTGTRSAPRRPRYGTGSRDSWAA